MTVQDLFWRVKKNPLVRGVTFSGGEPFSQAEPFTELAKLLKANGYEVASYTGYTFEELLENGTPAQKQLLAALGCPEHLYKKAPTADLEDDRPSLPDEAALGVTYDNIDDYLEGKKLDEGTAKIIEGWYLKTEHKRRPPITVFDDFWK